MHDEKDWYQELNGGTGGGAKKSNGSWLRKGDDVPPMDDDDRPRGYFASKLQSLFSQEEDFDVKASLEAAMSTAKTKLPGFDLSKINLDLDITEEHLIEAVSIIDLNTAGGISERKMYERRRRLEEYRNNQEDVYPTDNPIFENMAYNNPIFGNIGMSDMKSLYNGENKMFRQAILVAHANVRNQYKRSRTAPDGKKNDRHRHLQANGSCPVPCDIDDISCNCKRLYDCAGNITPTDLSVMFLNGYVD